MLLPISFDEIKRASDRIHSYIHQTPVLTSQHIDQLVSANFYFKCENFQKVGAFKMRGASNAVLQLTEEDRKNGIATHSSGNHAQAIALIASQLKIPSYIVMPSNTPKIKKEAVAGYGGKIIECEPTLQSRESTLNSIIEKTGAVFIHPYNDNRIIAGQATAALELLNKIKDLDYVIAPVGGGGLLSGTALAAHYLSPTTQVIGVEPQLADDAYRSLQTGILQPAVPTQTIADGLRGALGTKTFPIIQHLVEKIICVSEEEITQTMKLIMERMKIVIEPSAAVPLAGVLKEKKNFEDKRIGIIISGGNIDLNYLI